MACARFQDQAFRNLSLKRIQCDEIWSFCYAKDKNLPEVKRDVFGYGSVWTCTALDAETKLVPCWMVGPRDAESAREFMSDLASRLATRVQLTTDGHKPYLEAVGDAFGAQIDTPCSSNSTARIERKKLVTVPPITLAHEQRVIGNPVKDTFPPVTSTARISP